MLLKVEIFNFQSHKHTIIDFVNGLNVILGDTDSGKSAIIRAIKWVLFNSPSGNYFKSHWGGDTEVILTFDDGNVVSRKKGKTDTYTLNGTVFKSFGTKVPDEIKAVLKMDEINLQEQINQYFLLTETSGYVASFFNKIAHIEQIDEGTKSIKKEIRETKARIKVNKKTRKDKEKQVKRFTFLEKMKSDISEIDRLQEQATEISVSHEKLEKTISKIEKIQESIIFESKALLMEEDIDKILNLYKKQKEIKKLYKDLKTSVTEIETVQNKIKEYENKIEIEKDINSIITLIEKRKRIKSEITILETSLTKYKEITKRIEKTTNKHLTKHKQFEKEMGSLEACPLCNREFE